jgi:uncharacterized SAM-dependent methyltransferase
VRIVALGLNVQFASGERIHTENSYKYTPGQLSELLAIAGFRTAHIWNDPREWFSVILARLS